MEIVWTQNAQNKFINKLLYIEAEWSISVAITLSPNTSKISWQIAAGLVIANMIGTGVFTSLGRIPDQFFCFGFWVAEWP